MNGYKTKQICIHQDEGQVIAYDCKVFTYCIIFQGKKREQQRKWNSEGNVHVLGHGSYKASNSLKLLRSIFLDPNISLEEKKHAKDVLEMYIVEASGRIIIFKHPAGYHWTKKWQSVKKRCCQADVAEKFTGKIPFELDLPLHIGVFDFQDQAFEMAGKFPSYHDEPASQCQHGGLTSIAPRNRLE